MSEQKISEADTTTAEYGPIPETVSEALKRWDSGQPVFTVEMGGLGPGYEQAIQIAAFEIMREFKDDAGVPEMTEAEFNEKWDAEWRARADHAIPEGMGLTGAQAGGAMNLAFCVLRRGYGAALREDAAKNRLIQVSQNWPSNPSPLPSTPAAAPPEKD